MRYVQARFDEEQRAETYRFYVSEAIRGVTGADKGYFDLLEALNRPVDRRTGDEIKKSIIEKIRKIGGA